MRHENRLAKIEANLPPDPRIVAEAEAMAWAEWLSKQPPDDAVMWLSCWATLGELGIDAITPMCQSHESPLMAICRLCEWDYRRILEMSNEWKRENR
jgi:hypothetical protein